MKTFGLILAAGFLFFALAAAGAQTPAADSGLPANPVYQKNCAKCHGKTAQGHFLHGPSLVTDKVAAMPAEDVRNVISNGKGHMPKFAGKLTAEEIETLVQQIKALKK